MTTMSGSTFSSMTSSVFFGAGGQGRGGKLKTNFNNRRQKHGGAMQITAMGKKARGKGKPPHLRHRRRQILVAEMLLQEEEEEEAQLQRNRTNR